jgi:hypothetical protein
MLDPHSIFMIWPEFQDENGNVITRTDSVVAREGIARMWIINPQTRPLHRDKIKLGLKGYFMEGSRRVAGCEVVEIVSLENNPIE